MHLEILTRESPCLEAARQLYLQAFPVEERRDSENMLPENANFRPAILRREGESCGILFYWESREFIFLEHFSIEPRLRNAGLGAKALELLKAMGKPIILEIELPEDELTRRRKAFYERNGFRENPWHHIQPKYRRGDEDLRLLLLSYPAAITKDTWQRFETFLEENVAFRQG